MVMSGADKISFRFGKNWLAFADLLSAQEQAQAVESLQKIFGVDNFHGKSFIDIGSGSGLFSLAAHTLGAKRIVAFDLDPLSVSCTRKLLEKTIRVDSSHILIQQGSILDSDFIASLGKADFVYSWGVLHHTGDLAHALDSVASLVAPGGLIALAIYNKTWTAKFWLGTKRIYNRSYAPCKFLFHGALFLATCLARLFAGDNPFRKNGRGMNVWHDSIDWLGGLPYEWAGTEEIISLMTKKGFIVSEVWPVKGFQHGCNEFCFKLPARDPAIL